MSRTGTDGSAFHIGERVVGRDGRGSVTGTVQDQCGGYIFVLPDPPCALPAGTALIAFRPDQVRRETQERLL